jgi:hypothetical protein
MHASRKARRAADEAQALNMHVKLMKSVGQDKIKEMREQEQLKAELQHAYRRGDEKEYKRLMAIVNPELDATEQWKLMESREMNKFARSGK